MWYKNGFKFEGKDVHTLSELQKVIKDKTNIEVPYTQLKKFKKASLLEDNTINQQKFEKMINEDVQIRLYNKEHHTTYNRSAELYMYKGKMMPTNEIAKLEHVSPKTMRRHLRNGYDGTNK